MKSCTCCGEIKDESLFQIRIASRDGRTASCKSFLSLRDKARESKKRADARAFYQKNHGKEKADSAKKRYIERNPKKRKVHCITGNAIRDRVLKKLPCEVCGKTDVNAHHDDYDKPLTVRWLCPEHHAEWHKINGEGLNGES